MDRNIVIRIRERLIFHITLIVFTDYHYVTAYNVFGLASRALLFSSMSQGEGRGSWETLGRASPSRIPRGGTYLSLIYFCPTAIIR